MALKDIIGGGKKGGSPVVQILLFVLLCVVIWKAYKAFKVSSNAAGQAVGNVVLAAANNIAVSRVVYIRSLADEIWTNVNKYLFFWDYPEELMIRNINKLSTIDEVRLMDQIYKESSGESLYASVDACMSSTVQQRINSQWLAALKS